MAASDQRDQQTREHLRRTSDLSFITNRSGRGESQKSRILDHVKRSLG